MTQLQNYTDYKAYVYLTKGENNVVKGVGIVPDYNYRRETLITSADEDPISKTFEDLKEHIFYDISFEYNHGHVRNSTDTTNEDSFNKEIKNNPSGVFYNIKIGLFLDSNPIGE